MTLLKCPRCELNYITEKEQICKICFREIYGKMPREDMDICSTCNEAPTLPGKDVCRYCQREMNKQKGLKPEEEETVEIGLEPVSAMEEMIPDLREEEEEDPSYRVLGDALSLEELSEQENSDDEPQDE